MQSHNDVLKTPSSLMGSQGHGQGLNVSQYLMTSPIGTRRDTQYTNMSGGNAQASN